MDYKPSAYGAYAEYNFSPADVAQLDGTEKSEKHWFDDLSFNLGLRYDYHVTHGSYITPRASFRYKTGDLSVLRFSIGSGARIPYVFTENQAVFVTNRKLGRFESPNLERAINLGLNYTQQFLWDERAGNFSIDLYRTTFQEQYVVDLYNPSLEIEMYNEKGYSYTNSLLAQWNYELLNDLDIKLAYKYNRSVQRFESGLEQRPLFPEHRALANLVYRPGGWTINATYQWTGSQLLPDNSAIPADLLNFHPEETDPYGIVNLQLGYKWKWLDLYSGVENLFSETQEFPIISYADSGSPYFDAGQVFKPVFGRRIFAGVRLKFE